MESTTSKVQELEARIQDLLLINEQHRILNGHLRKELELTQGNHDECWTCTCGIATNCNCKHLKLFSWKELDVDTLLRGVLDD